MKIFKAYRSPHFKDQIIPVEFVILHYTAQSLKESLNIFLSPESKVSCHLLIDRDGSTYELVDCWEVRAKKAFHAGHSLWRGSENKNWKGFNNFSIGIELVNWNGNLFPYPDKQYQSLFEVLTHLKTQYPQLKNPDRLLGHEHIAGFRGKKDPGYLFDWSYLFQNVYGESNQSKNKIEFVKSYPKGSLNNNQKRDKSIYSKLRDTNNQENIVSQKENLKKDNLKIKDQNTGDRSVERLNSDNKDKLKNESLRKGGNTENKNTIDKNNSIEDRGNDKKGIDNLHLINENRKHLIRKSVLTKREIESLQFLKESKKWSDKKAKRISLTLENTYYPFWFKKYILFFYHLLF